LSAGNYDNNNDNDCGIDFKGGKWDTGGEFTKAINDRLEAWGMSKTVRLTSRGGHSAIFRCKTVDPTDKQKEDCSFIISGSQALNKTRPGRHFHVTRWSCKHTCDKYKDCKSLPYEGRNYYSDVLQVAGEDDDT
jgi:hypothetical protein